MALIALKVDVDTLRGTLEGVPRLLGILERRGITATFLFSLGPDHTGWALRRVLRPGFLAKVKRTSVVRHYGLRTLLYGVLLPAPSIGRRGVAAMRLCHAAGHECGIHAWDHVLWQDNVTRRDARWTRSQMALAHERFRQVFDELPATHGAAGWQMNDEALRQVDDWGMAYASDCRGRGPFRPLLGARALRHVQLPTTLPTIDELLGVDGVGATNVSAALLSLTEHDADQVFTLHAELEGAHFAPAFEATLDGWQRQGHRLGSLAMLHRSLVAERLPLRRVVWGSIPGRSGTVLMAECTGAGDASTAAALA